MIEGLRVVEEDHSRKLRIEIFPRRTLFGRRWYFRVRGKNGEPIAQSEGYHNRADARSTAQMLRDDMPGAEIFGAEQ